jgi:hypothetical protein
MNDGRKAICSTFAATRRMAEPAQPHLNGTDPRRLWIGVIRPRPRTRPLIRPRPRMTDHQGSAHAKSADRHLGAPPDRTAYQPRTGRRGHRRQPSGRRGRSTPTARAGFAILRIAPAVANLLKNDWEQDERHSESYEL